MTIDPDELVSELRRIGAVVEPGVLVAAADHIELLRANILELVKAESQLFEQAKMVLCENVSVMLHQLMKQWEDEDVSYDDRYNELLVNVCAVVGIDRPAV